MRSTWAIAIGGLLACQACGEKDSNLYDAAGGSPTSRGGSSSGGQSTSGGSVTMVGGQVGTGGVSSGTGGTTEAGTTSSGGMGEGGDPTQGGGAPEGGMSPNSGGTATTGGSVAEGGSPAEGGTTAQGGAPLDGGAAGEGALPGQGGTGEGGAGGLGEGGLGDGGTGGVPGPTVVEVSLPEEIQDCVELVCPAEAPYVIACHYHLTNEEFGDVCVAVEEGDSGQLAFVLSGRACATSGGGGTSHVSGGSITCSSEPADTPIEDNCTFDAPVLEGDDVSPRYFGDRCDCSPLEDDEIAIPGCD